MKPVTFGMRLSIVYHLRSARLELTHCVYNERDEGTSTRYNFRTRPSSRITMSSASELSNVRASHSNTLCYLVK
jgi:hypothetical protein